MQHAPIGPEPRRIPAPTSRRHLEADGLRWLVGVPTAVVGAMMLALPGRFSDPTFSLLRPGLHLWGVAFLLGGQVLVAAGVMQPGRRVLAASHHSVGALWLVLAASSLAGGDVFGLASWGPIAAATLVAPFVSRPTVRPPQAHGIRLVTLSAAAVALAVGILLLTVGPLRSAMGPTLGSRRELGQILGILLLVAGVLLAHAELRRPRRILWWMAHFFLGVVFATCAVLVLTGVGLGAMFALYGGIALMLLMLPWLEDPVRRVQPTSLQTRLAFIFAVAVSLPILGVISVLDDILIATAGGAVPSSALDPAREAAFALYLAIVAVAVVLAIVVSRWLTSPLRSLSRAIAAFASGDSRLDLPDRGPLEVMALVDEFRKMRETRERLEEWLRQSEEHFRATFEQAAVGVAHLGADGTFQRANARLCDILGYPNDELSRLSLRDLIDGEHREAVARGERQLLAGLSDTFSVEVRCTSRGGAPVWLSLTMSLVRGLDGVARHFVVIADDVGARKWAEAERERLLAQLNALLASLSEAVTVFDPSGRIALRNAAAERITGMSSEVAASAYAPESRVYYDAEGNPLALEDWPQSRVIRGEVLEEYEVVLARPDGSRRRLVYNSGAIRDAAGRVELGILVFRDVTDLRRLEEARREMVSLVSHDLRNPLATLKGHAQLLELGLLRRGHHSDAESVRAILRSAERMNSMIQDLVDSARLESGAIELRLEPTDLRRLVEDVVGRVQPPTAQARVRVDGATDLPRATADPARIDRVVTNLVANALKYSPADRPVVVSLTSTAGQVVCAVTDEGVGLSPEDVPRVFDRYFRARTTRSSEGIGLGLYIVRLMIEAHGGRIWVDSNLGRGSTFAFSLPASGSAGREPGLAR